jgi:hypothetical protein
MNRILFGESGTLTDLTNDLSSYSTGTAVIPSASGSFYIGSRNPFNNIYFKMLVASTESVVMSVQYWSESDWVDVVDLADGTAGLTQSGMINFTPDREDLWERESTNYEGETIPDLSTVTIYDRYWLKINFDGALSPTTSLIWVGHKFSNDADLAAEFPDLDRSNVKTSFKAGKTDWEEQHVMAAEVMITDLMDKGIIQGAGGIIDWTEYRGAAVQKCAEIIFRSFGDDYIDRAKEAREEYLRRIDKRKPVVDRNNNATEDAFEQKFSTGWVSR